MGVKKVIFEQLEWGKNGFVHAMHGQEQKKGTLKRGLSANEVFYPKRGWTAQFSLRNN